MSRKALQVPRRSPRLFDIPTFEAGADRRADPSILPPHIAKNTYNFEFTSGVLREGYGIEESGLNFPEGVTAVWVYNKGCAAGEPVRRIYMCAVGSGGVYFTEDRRGDFVRLAGVSLTSPPMAANYRLYGEDVIIISSPTDDMVVWDGEGAPRVIPDTPRVTSMAIHYERMFVTSADRPDAVRFSEDLDPTNWSESLDTGGFIEMIDERGRLLRVISYLNYVYIFREYGISRLTAFAAQEDFSVVNLFVSGSRICPGSIALCGDRVMFLASDGLYMFNGISTQKVLGAALAVGGAGGSAGDGAAAGFGDGKYYLAANFDFGDGRRVGVEKGDYINNALVVIDMADGRHSVTRGVDITRITAAGSGTDNLFAVLRDGRCGNITPRSGRCFGDILPKCWETGHSDFGRPDRSKLLREINVNTRYDITVTVITDREERSFFVQGKPTVSRVKANMIGRLMTVRYESGLQRAYVSRPSMTVRQM